MRRLAAFVLLTTILAGPASGSAHEAESPAATCDAVRADQPVRAVSAATPTAAATPLPSMPAADVVVRITGVAFPDRPMTVSREADAGSGTVAISLPAPLDAVKVEIQAVSGEAGQIGTVEQAGNYLVFHADTISYELEPVTLPSGITVQRQLLDLDPDHADVLCIDTVTGAIFRHFRWVMTGTNTTYNGGALSLEDTAKVEVIGVDDRGDGTIALHLRTRWKGSFALDNWTIDDQAMPAGQFAAASIFEDTYIVNLGG